MVEPGCLFSALTVLAGVWFVVRLAHIRRQLDQLQATALRDIDIDRQTGRTDEDA